MNLDYSNPLIKAICDKWGLELELKVTESRLGEGRRLGEGTAGLAKEGWNGA